MNPKRRSRLYLALFLLVAVGGTATVLLMAMEQNINTFYPPEDVIAGVAPIGTQIRVGGMVADGSLQRESNSLAVQFVISDMQGAQIDVAYEGILPDLFREGQGIIVTGTLDEAKKFTAIEVLAKHDENYMPPELMDMAEEGKAEAGNTGKNKPSLGDYDNGS